MRGEIITREEMLTIPAFEISDLNLIPSKPLVSVIIITYNHEAFIEQTIQGILAQKCDFPIEIIIGEDKSQDRTLAICLDYQKRYPQLIRVVTWHENVGPNANVLRVWGRARGKYLAVCEGDDYWIDPAKLTKQVALMDQFPDTVLCGTEIGILQHGYMEQTNVKLQYFIDEILCGQYFHTSTFLFRTAKVKMPLCARSVFNLDSVLMVVASLHGSVRCIPDRTSVYRRHESGIYTQLDRTSKDERELATLKAISKFLDEIHFPVIRKRMDVKSSWLCHNLASKGQLTRARRLARETVCHFFLHDPKQALILLFHMCLPRTYQAVFRAWTRRKQPDGLIR